MSIEPKPAIRIRWLLDGVFFMNRLLLVVVCCIATHARAGGREDAMLDFCFPLGMRLPLVELSNLMTGSDTTVIINTPDGDRYETHHEAFIRRHHADGTRFAHYSTGSAFNVVNGGVTSDLATVTQYELIVCTNRTYIFSFVNLGISNSTVIAAVTSATFRCRDQSPAPMGLQQFWELKALMGIP
jgi:hypothetical protein